jgi:hypothetical protein
VAGTVSIGGMMVRRQGRGGEVQADRQRGMHACLSVIYCLPLLLQCTALSVFIPCLPCVLCLLCQQGAPADIYSSANLVMPEMVARQAYHPQPAAPLPFASQVRCQTLLPACRVSCLLLPLGSDQAAIRSCLSVPLLPACPPKSAPLRLPGLRTPCVC